MQWKIYYGDFSSFSSITGSAYDAPALNVQMIAVADPEHGWYLCRSNDYYWYLAEHDTWQGGDIFGLWDHLITPGPKKIVFGRTVSHADFEKILMQAYNDPEIPQKTGFKPREHGAPS